MNNEESPAVKPEIEAVYIKEEDIHPFHQHEEVQTYLIKGIKNEEVKLDETGICNEIFVDNQNSKHNYGKSAQNVSASKKQQETMNRRYRCVKNCGKSFDTLYLLTNHTQFHGHRPFKCPENGCRKSFKAKTDVSAHLVVHSKILFTCPVGGCGKAYKTKRALEGHEVTHSQEITSFKCTHRGCKDKLKNREDLMEHTRLHNVEKRFQCSHTNCFMGFSTKMLLNLHEGTHSLDVDVCEFPGCNTQQFHHRHMLNHFLSRRYRCSFAGCVATFEASDEFKKHIKTHMGGGETSSGGAIGEARN